MAFLFLALPLLFYPIQIYKQFIGLGIDDSPGDDDGQGRT